MRQKEGSQTGIDHARKVKADAVGSGNKCGHTFGPCDARDASHIAIPLRVKHTAVVTAPGATSPAGKTISMCPC